MKILYSFNKRGFEAQFWAREIAAASDGEITFIPFNHDPYVDISRYLRAQQLDNLYFDRHAGLMRLYSDVEARVRDEGIDALIVDNCPPYHPDWLRGLPVYKVLRTSDGPICAYDRDFAYVHAYDHVLYHSPAYSRDLSMKEKLRYVGAKRVDFWPLGFFETAYDPTKTENTILGDSRDIDVVFIGALHSGKMRFLADIKRAIGKRCRLFGINGWKRNLYFNLRYGFPAWLRPVPFSIYQRAKIGFNLHNRGDFTVGSYRLFELPANGVMQISDGGHFLGAFFNVGEEIVGYQSSDDLIDKIRFYLHSDSERERIAVNGFRRVVRDYNIKTLLRRAGRLIRDIVRNQIASPDLATPESFTKSGTEA